MRCRLLVSTAAFSSQLHGEFPSNNSFPKRDTSHSFFSGIGRAKNGNIVTCISKELRFSSRKPPLFLRSYILLSAPALSHPLQAPRKRWGLVLKLAASLHPTRSHCLFSKQPSPALNHLIIEVTLHLSPPLLVTENGFYAATASFIDALALGRRVFKEEIWICV